MGEIRSCGHLYLPAFSTLQISFCKNTHTHSFSLCLCLSLSRAPGTSTAQGGGSARFLQVSQARDHGLPSSRKDVRTALCSSPTGRAQAPRSPRPHTGNSVFGLQRATSQLRVGAAPAVSSLTHTPARPLLGPPARPLLGPAARPYLLAGRGSVGSEAQLGGARAGGGGGRRGPGAPWPAAPRARVGRASPGALRSRPRRPAAAVGE